MSKDACPPVCLFATSGHCLFDSGKEVSSVFGQVRMSQSSLCVWVGSPCAKEFSEVRILFCRYKGQAVSKKLCSLLVKLLSLRLQRGVKCGRKVHGHSVVSFTVQKSFAKRIRVSELHLTACSLTDTL